MDSEIQLRSLGKEIIFKISGSGGVATAYVERKRRDRNPETACQALNMDFEPIIFIISGGCEMGARGLLKNICQEYDRTINSP